MSGSRSYGRGAAILSVGIGATGIITFAYFSLASYSLSKEDYGHITLLWSAVFITVSVLYRPVEQLLSRTIADRDARGVHGNEHLRIAATIQLGLGVLFAVGALLLRDPIENDLFGGSSTLYWILVVSVLAYAVSYFARGYLAGHREFPLYGGLVLMEASSRCLFALAVAIGIAEGQTVVALGMAAAPIVSLAVVPPALARRLAPRARADDGPRPRTPTRARPRPRARPDPRSTPRCSTPPRGSRARAGVHARPRRRLRGRRAGDHALRADLPERRSAARKGNRGLRRSGARRLHLQRAADRPCAAAALPGDPDVDPPPPHASPRDAASRTRSGAA